MRKYSYREVVDSYPKDHLESLWSKWVPRQLSFPIAFLLVNIGCSAWLASVISIVFALAACFFLCLPSSAMRWVGIVFLILWHTFDCVDGTIARVTKKASSMGEFIDAQSGYTVMAFVFFSVGMAAFNTRSIIFSDANKYFLIIIGAISSISNITARLINSKYAFCDLKKCYIKHLDYNVNEANERPTTTFAKIRVFADYHLGLVGVFIPLLILCQFVEVYDIVTIAYCLYSIAGFVFASAFYAIKSK